MTKGLAMRIRILVVLTNTLFQIIPECTSVRNTVAQWYKESGL